MKHYSDKEIIEFFESLELDDNPYRDFEIDVLTNTENYVRVTVKQMYEYVNMSYEVLSLISEFFDTTKISDSRYASSGCSTCDHGSSYEITLHIGERV